LFLFFTELFIKADINNVKTQKMGNKLVRSESSKLSKPASSASSASLVGSLVEVRQRFVKPARQGSTAVAATLLRSLAVLGKLELVVPSDCQNLQVAEHARANRARHRLDQQCSTFYLVCDLDNTDLRSLSAKHLTGMFVAKLESVGQVEI
jgi:hypothetical protein